MFTTTRTPARGRIPQLGLLLSLVAAVLLGAVLVQGADAEWKTTVSIKKRVQSQRSACETAGGTLTVSKRPGGTTTTCTGGDLDGQVCINSSKKTHCFQTSTMPPSSPVTDPAAPPADGNEQPGDGGSHAGGGAGGIDPGWNGEQPNDSGPSDGGGVILTAYDGGTHHKAKHEGKHRRHGHGHEYQA